MDRKTFYTAFLSKNAGMLQSAYYDKNNNFIAYEYDMKHSRIVCQKRGLTFITVKIWDDTRKIYQKMFFGVEPDFTIREVGVLPVRNVAERI